MARGHKVTSEHPILPLPLVATDIVEVWRDGVQYHAPFEALGGVPDAHEGSHQLTGTDPVCTDTPTANAIPAADGAGKLDTWISDASTSVKGKVRLASHGEETSGEAMQSDDPRGKDARPPESHAATHVGGSDPIEPATASTDGLMSSEDKGKLDDVAITNLPTAGEKAALAGSFGTPSASNKYVTDSDPRMLAAGGIITSGLIITVGATGDFLTLSEALEYASRFTQIADPAIAIEINLQSTFAIAEQIKVIGLDLGRIIINGDAGGNSITRSAITSATITGTSGEAYYPVFTASNCGVLPVIFGSYTIDTSGSDLGQSFIICDGGAKCYIGDVYIDGFTGYGFVARTGGMINVQHADVYNTNTMLLSRYGGHISYLSGTEDTVTVDAEIKDFGIIACDSTVNTRLNDGTGLFIDTAVMEKQVTLTETNGTVDLTDMYIHERRHYFKSGAYHASGYVFSPASGATIEGKASVTIYGQYSVLDVERISATLYAIRDLSDGFDYTPVLSFGGATTGITYGIQTGRCRRNKGGSCCSVLIVLTSKGTATGINAVTLGTTPKVGVSGALNVNAVTFSGALQVTSGSGSGNNYFRIRQITEAGTLANLTDTSFVNNSTILADICYEEL